ncbi:MAG: hypothetical protein AB7U20_04345 [Planctomycetaceae bacterium]
MEDEPLRYPPHVIEETLRAGRDQLPDVADRIYASGPAVDLSNSDRLLLYLACKLALLRPIPVAAKHAEINGEIHFGKELPKSFRSTPATF